MQFSLGMILLCTSNDFKIVYLEGLKGALSGLRQFLATESPFKMMKNTFYFTSKALFSRYLTFCIDLLVM